MGVVCGRGWCTGGDPKDGEWEGAEAHPERLGEGAGEEGSWTCVRYRERTDMRAQTGSWGI